MAEMAEPVVLVVSAVLVEPVELAAQAVTAAQAALLRPGV